MAEHTELIGGLITSTAAAEAAGNNRFSTGTLSASDLANHAEFEGSSIGIGASGGFNSSGSGDGILNQRQSTSDKSGLASMEASGSIGFGQESDSQGSTTYSGINTKNILITDAAKQTLLTGLSAEAMAERVLTATTTENAEALSGALANRFDAAALQKELDTQREVSQAFSQNVQSAKAELNRAADRLKTDYEAGRISQAEYEAKRQQLDNGALLLSTIAAGLSAPTNSTLGIATATLSPSVAKEIGQYFKSSDREGSTEHLIAHGLLAAAVAATGGNNALSAAGAAMSAEAAAPALAHYLYGKEATELNADEKATISSITGLVGAGVGGINGVDANLAQGAQSAGTAVDNNYLTVKQINDWVEEINSCETKANCNPIIEKYEQLSISQQEQLISDCANNPEQCAQDHGFIITDSLLVKQALENALSQDIPIKMAYDLMTLYIVQRDAEGVILSENFALELQERYGLSLENALLAGYAMNSVGRAVKAKSREPYQANEGAVGNMKEFFSQSGFGKQLEANSTKTSKIVQGQSVYRADDNMGNNIKKGNLYYLDGQHKNHIEVFDSRGGFQYVLNMDGSVNVDKTNKAKGRKLK